MKARIMYDREFIDECADRGGPRSVFQRINWASPDSSVSATERCRPMTATTSAKPGDSYRRFRLRNTRVDFCLDRIADVRVSKFSRDLNHAAKNCRIIDVPETPSILRMYKISTTVYLEKS